jgi:hypothetical protein
MTTLKTKWFKIRLPLNLKETHKALLENHYKTGGKSGFEIIEYTDSLLRAKFIEKIVSQEIVIDPFGNEGLLESVRYLIFEFSIISLYENDYLIKILFPPRSMKSFINIIYDIFGFGFFIQPVSFDLKIFLIAIEKNLNPTQLKVIKVNASGLVLTETSSAKLEIKSSKHAYHDLLEKFNCDNFTIDNMRISLRIDGVDGFIEVSKAGSICFSDRYDFKITQLVKQLLYIRK